MTEAARFAGSHHVDRRRFEKRERPAPYAKQNSTQTFPGGSHGPPYNRIFVSNIPYEQKWQTLKDLFRAEVGEVIYVELITDEEGNSRGFGVIEFKTREHVEEAVEKMRGYAIGDRKLVVKEDLEGRCLQKALSRVKVPGVQSTRDLPYASRKELPRHGRTNLPALMNPAAPKLAPVPVYQNAPISGHAADGRAIGNAVFVANLDYKVNYSKLKEIFKLAGNVSKIELHLDQNNKSRGMATIFYDNAAEALRAVTMFNKQLLYERPMVVKMDRENVVAKKPELPSGLQGIGPILNLEPMQPVVHSYYTPQQQPRVYADESQEYLPPVSAIPGLSQLSSHLSQMNRERAAYGGVQSIPGLRAGQSDHRGDQLHVRDRTQIDIDIARVDSRIRDLDKSLAVVRRSPDPNRFDNNRQAPNTTVFVRNLPFTLPWTKLRDEFSRIGSVQYVELKMVNGRSKGYGWVRYASPAEAENAILHLNGTYMDGRKIEVKYGEHTTG